jgi:small subunit ribosomal protein S18
MKRPHKPRRPPAAAGENVNPQSGPPGAPGFQRVRRRRECRFCKDKVDWIDYKDVDLLRSFIPERGKILPRRLSGICAPHQRMLGLAIKRARTIALLPHVAD